MEITKETQKENLNKWLKKNGLKQIADNIKISCKNVTYNLSSPEDCILLSSIWFLDLQSNEGVPTQKDKKSYHLVLKKPSLYPFVDNHMHVDGLIHNEILFFDRFAPENQNGDFPRCILTIEDREDLHNSVIITENVSYLGYEMCPIKYDIPFEYTISAMQAIGRFHGMCYVMKVREPGKFFDIVNNIEEVRYYPGEKIKEFHNLVSMRPVEWLRKQNYDPNFVDIMWEYLSDAFTNVMMGSLKPVEPLAVLCHGDFVRHNIFFKKIESGFDIMLIDFAMMRYSQPAIDLSTYMYLSASRENRNERFDDVFRAYHDTLFKYLQENGIRDLDEYSYAKLYDDYKHRAMFGYIIAIYFLPIIRGYTGQNLENIIDFDPVESAKFSKTLGGDAYSEQVAVMLLDLRDKGFLDHILNCTK